MPSSEALPTVATYDVICSESEADFCSRSREPMTETSNVTDHSTESTIPVTHAEAIMGRPITRALFAVPHIGNTALLAAITAVWVVLAMKDVNPYAAAGWFLMMVCGGALWMVVAVLHVVSLRGHAWARLALAAIAGVLVVGLAAFLVDPNELRSMRWHAGLLELAAAFALASWFRGRGR